MSKSKDSHVHRVLQGRNLNTHRAVIKVEAKWCSACSGCKEKYKKFADASYKKNENVKFYRCDYDTYKSRKSEHSLINDCVRNAKSLPTFFVISEGKVVATVVGWDAKKLEEKVRALH